MAKRRAKSVMDIRRQIERIARSAASGGSAARLHQALGIYHDYTSNMRNKTRAGQQYRQDIIDSNNVINNTTGMERQNELRRQSGLVSKYENTKMSYSARAGISG